MCSASQRKTREGKTKERSFARKGGTSAECAERTPRTTRPKRDREIMNSKGIGGRRGGCDFPTDKMTTTSRVFE